MVVGHRSEHPTALCSWLELLKATSFTTTGNPPQVHLELSADDIEFLTERPLPSATGLAIHLVLPDGYHLVAEARVSHARKISSGTSQSTANNYRIGTQLTDTDPVSTHP